MNRSIWNKMMAVCLTAIFAYAGQSAQSQETAVSTGEMSAQVVEYPAAFFLRYQPNTALDMVKQLPGFHLDDGDAVRGFTAAAGNILINGRRPSVKQDTPSDILGRIPATNVIRIDLVRGQMDGVDLQGQQVMANIIMREESPAAVRWEGFLWKNFYTGILMPGGSISLADKWGGIDFNAGLDSNYHAHITKGARNTDSGIGTRLENRNDKTVNKHFALSGNLNATGWMGETLVQLNTRVAYNDINDLTNSYRRPLAPGTTPRNETFDEVRNSYDIEVGLNAERNLLQDLTGKAILIFNRGDLDTVNDQTVVNLAGQQILLRESDTGTVSSEAISRLEFDWQGMPNHAIQLNLEAAFNALDNSLLQTVDTGIGPAIEDVPGANTRVEEIRGDFLLKDTWSLGAFEFDYGLGAEVSKISQTGDSELERNFFFLKPESMLSYAPVQGRQTRLRLAREISQLDFNDFVSVAVFQDEDLALGNPNLSPDKTWVFELTHERRFGEISVIKATAFHHWISDVVDLLPLTSIYEAPGNIGDGRRWGLKVENTIPMDWLGLDNSRLNVRARWQDSTVIDPVTGGKRELSGESGLVGTIPYQDEDIKYTAAIDFRQDFQEARVAWGWETRFRSERVLYKVNELDIFDEGTDLSLFTETTRWFGVKMRLTLKDLFNIGRNRVRTIYIGERGNSAVSRRELIDNTRGRQIDLVVSGSF
jgi:hypothetical protein